jgi:hypothetical protein
MRGALPPLPQHAFMAWCLVKAEGQLCLPLRPQNIYANFTLIVATIASFHIIPLSLAIYNLSV